MFLAKQKPRRVRDRSGGFFSQYARSLHHQRLPFNTNLRAEGKVPGTARFKRARLALDVLEAD
jgi:hypothetical protein